MRCTKSHTFFLDKDSGYIVTRLYQFLNMLETTSVWKWLLWCNISLWWWTHQNTQVYYFSLQSIFDNIIVWPAYTSLGHGQNFVQKDWVNGLSSHAPDEERIGSTIIVRINNAYPIFDWNAPYIYIYTIYTVSCC